MEFRNLTADERSDLRDQFRELARTFARRSAVSEGAGPADRRRMCLAQLRVLGIMQSELDLAVEAEARAAAADGANFRELGDAWGITRQAARKRWSRVRTALPADGRPLPDVSKYDDLLPSHQQRGTSRPAAAWARYQSRPGRAVLVADSLDSLRGPADGIVELPLWLFWSAPDRTFDLSKPYMLRSMYETVLGEAGCPEDLTGWLDRDTLIRLWPDLYLPKGV
ncbi:MAG: hypothetical protein ACRDOH_34500, partial [Streptosporangiaceae bacterium]